MLDEIRSGSFANEWMAEHAAGKPNFKALEKKAAEHPLEEVGRRLRSLMPWMNEERMVKEREKAAPRTPSSGQAGTALAGAGSKG
jgi:ketol-acid reductoisomerase